MEETGFHTIKEVEDSDSRKQSIKEIKESKESLETEKEDRTTQTEQFKDPEQVVLDQKNDLENSVNMLENENGNLKKKVAQLNQKQKDLVNS